MAVCRQLALTQEASARPGKVGTIHGHGVLEVYEALLAVLLELTDLTDYRDVLLG